MMKQSKNKLYQTIITGWILASIVLPFQVIAQGSDSTDPESTQSAVIEDDPQVKQSIKERIQMAVTKSQNNGEVPQSLAYVGEIESITDQSVSVILPDETVLISIDDDTTIVDEDKEALSVEDLAIGSGVIVVSSQVDTSTILAIEIISLEELPTQPVKQSSLVQVISVDEEDETIEVLTRPNTDLITYELTNTATLTDRFGNDIELTDIQSGDELILIYVENEDDDEEEVTQELIRVQQITTTAVETTTEATDSAETLQE